MFNLKKDEEVVEPPHPQLEFTSRIIIPTHIFTDAAEKYVQSMYNDTAITVFCIDPPCQSSYLIQSDYFAVLKYTKVI